MFWEITPNVLIEHHPAKKVFFSLQQIRQKVIPQNQQKRDIYQFLQSYISPFYRYDFRCNSHCCWLDPYTLLKSTSLVKSPHTYDEHSHVPRTSQDLILGCWHFKKWRVVPCGGGHVYGVLWCFFDKFWKNDVFRWFQGYEDLRFYDFTSEIWHSAESNLEFWWQRLGVCLCVVLTHDFARPSVC